MSEMEELLVRVERADGPDRDLDAAIDVALFGGETVWRQANYTMDNHPASKRPSTNHVGGFAFEPVPFITSNPTDAMGAVLQKFPGWSWKLVREGGKFSFVLRDAPKLEVVAPAWVCSRQEPALAILVCLLNALIAEESK